MMDAKFKWQSIFKIPEALRLGHDEARAELVRATSMPGRIGEAAGRVARLCLPHFEREEEMVFPVFGVLRELESGKVRPEMAEILPLVSNFKAWHDSLDYQHQAITSAIHALLLASHKEYNREIAEFAYGMRVHERLEDEVIYPMVPVIGRYVQERLEI
jgi:hemerythrin superfamily protein